MTVDPDANTTVPVTTDMFEMVGRAHATQDPETDDQPPVVAEQDESAPGVQYPGLHS